MIDVKCVLCGKPYGGYNDRHCNCVRATIPQWQELQDKIKAYAETVRLNDNLTEALAHAVEIVDVKDNHFPDAGKKVDDE